MIKRILALFFVGILVLVPGPVSAQTSEPSGGPVYIIQPGDTLWDIAALFNVTVDDIVRANNLPGGDIYVGDRLIIPGLENVTGTLVTEIVLFGETLRSLTRQYGMDPAIMRRLNRLISPTEIYAGYRLILVEQENRPNLTGRTSLDPGGTLLELAVREGISPWTIAGINNLDGIGTSLPYEVLYLPSGDSSTAGTGLPTAILSVDIDPLPTTQGATTQIKVQLAESATLGGALVDHPLHFFQVEDGSWVALQGVHAMTEPGLYPLRLDVTLPNGGRQSFEQLILVRDAYFQQDPVLIVDQLTVDPAITEPENQQLLAITEPATPQKYWDGIFQLPVDEQYCLRSFFGNRRSYNDSDYIYFHTGVDYGVCSEAHPFDIYAPADGVVVFAGELIVRGNATVIDHGWGIYSGFWHQEAILVSPGEQVAAGQLIGKIGKTGRVTGPHLHWEVWANGIQVNPLQWLDEALPKQVEPTGQ